MGQRYLFFAVLILVCNVPVQAALDYNLTLESYHSDESALLRPLKKGERMLIQVQILSRHGMRAPDQSYPGNPNPESVWREGLGRLTQHGKHQMFALGRQLRWMYRNFITSSPVEVEVQSSKRDRCLLSVLCNVAALYQPTSDWEFLPNFHWQPIPIQYIEHGKDPYLGKIFDCPAAQKEIEKMHSSEEGKKFLNENKELFEYLALHSGLKIKSWKDAATLYDILNMDKIYNFMIPDWAHKHWDDLHHVNDMSYYLSGKTKKYQKLRAGPLLDLMAGKFDLRISGTSNKKVCLYSGHSKTLVAVLSALGVFNMKEPPFCATLIFELYREYEGHSIRLLYLNSTTPEMGDQEPHVLTIPDCKEYCPYDTFASVVEELTPKDWEKECK